MVCMAVFLSCVGLVVCLRAWWFHVDRSSSISPCACGSTSGMRDGGHVAPPSYIYHKVLCYEDVCVCVCVCVQRGFSAL